jgi:hypothetical protein
MQREQDQAEKKANLLGQMEQTETYGLYCEGAGKPTLRKYMLSLLGQYG